MAGEYITITSNMWSVVEDRIIARHLIYYLASIAHQIVMDVIKLMVCVCVCVFVAGGKQKRRWLKMKKTLVLKYYLLIS